MSNNNPDHAITLTSTRTTSKQSLQRISLVGLDQTTNQNNTPKSSPKQDRQSAGPASSERIINPNQATLWTGMLITMAMQIDRKYRGIPDSGFSLVLQF
jgi:hypothetical protein